MDPPITEISDGDTTWRFDRSFLTSSWTCIWGRGCLGILSQPVAELGHGCCSIGADLDGDDEARRIGALAATLEPSRFEYHATAAEGGVFGDSARSSTRVVDGAISTGALVLTGGGALLQGLGARLQEETGILVVSASDPLSCVAIGAGQCVEEFDILKQVLVTSGY
jgi:hypothetical protein